MKFNLYNILEQKIESLFIYEQFSLLISFISFFIFNRFLKKIYKSRVI